MAIKWQKVLSHLSGKKNQLLTLCLVLHGLILFPLRLTAVMFHTDQTSASNVPVVENRKAARKAFLTLHQSKHWLHRPISLLNFHSDFRIFQLGAICNFSRWYINSVGLLPLSEPVWHWPAFFVLLHGIWFFLLTCWPVSGPRTTISKGSFEFSSI